MTLPEEGPARSGSAYIAILAIIAFITFIYGWLGFWAAVTVAIVWE